MSNWNPVQEHIEGRLCERGLMQERYDSQKDELVRTLTFNGKFVAEELLRDPKWRKVYLKLAKEKIAQFPLPIRKLLWKEIANQLKNIK